MIEQNKPAKASIKNDIVPLGQQISSIHFFSQLYMQLTPETIIEATWQNLLSSASPGNGNQELLLMKLMNSLYEPGRYYHNTSHIASLLEWLNKLEAKFNRPDRIAWTILYHDVIYNPRRQDNEEASAKRAEEELSALGLAEEDINWISDTIKRTQSHDGSGADQDALLFLDMDLSILGISNEAYQVYVENIRKEYHWVPKKIYQIGRKKVLSRFLERSSIYYTDVFKIPFEIPARENLEWEIQQL